MWAAARRSRRCVLVVFVHEEADGAAMHAVDRLAGVHELVQGLQHEAVAAERDDDVGLPRARHCRSAWRAGAAPPRPRRSGWPRRRCARSSRVGGALAVLAHGARFSSGRRQRRPQGHADMERALLVYTTYPSIVEAERAGRSIEERGWPPASTSCPAWCRTIGGRARSSAARRW